VLALSDNILDATNDFSLLLEDEAELGASRQTTCRLQPKRRKLRAERLAVHAQGALLYAGAAICGQPCVA